MENIICNLCAGSPEIELYRIELSKDEKEKINRNGNIVKTDVCIGKEVEYLIREGVRTLGSCCGHGEGKPTVLVDKRDRDKIQQMGYETNDFNYINGDESNMIDVELKVDIQKELRTVLEKKVFRYLEKHDDA